MNNKVFEVIDFIEKTDLKKRLDYIKNEIINDKNCTYLINKFNESKDLYKKYNFKDDYIKYKKKMYDNNLINEYLKIQNMFNLLQLKINSRLNEITKK